ncbi:unnamed protein product [Phaeothamnion confervicola]
MGGIPGDSRVPGIASPPEAAQHLPRKRVVSFELLQESMGSRSDDELVEHAFLNPHKAHHQDRASVFVIFLTLVAAVGGFLFGYDTGVISGAMLKIREEFGLSEWEQEVVVSVTVAGAIAGSVFGGPANQRFGRRPVILFSAATFTLGAILMAAARSFFALACGRLVVGVGIGIASLTAPIYIAEAAPSHLRGTLLTLNTLLITVGQVSAGVVDGVLAHADGGWRYMLGLAAVPSVFMALGFTVLPESPRWLVSAGRPREALLVLQRLRGTTDVRDEMEEMLQQNDGGSGGGNGGIPGGGVHGGSGHGGVVAVGGGGVGGKGGGGGTGSNGGGSVSGGGAGAAPYSLADALREPPVRRALLLGCGLQALQQLSGINTVMYYSASIFSMAGFSDDDAIWLAAYSALAQALGVCVGIYFIERLGRRPLILVSLAMVTVMLTALGESFRLSRAGSLPATPSLDLADAACQRTRNVFLGEVATASCYQCVRIDGCGFCEAGGWDSGVGILGSCFAAAAVAPEVAVATAVAAKVASAASVAGAGGATDVSGRCAAESWHMDQCGDPYGWAAAAAVLLYLLAFGVGMSSVPWTVNAEIYPTKARSLCTSVSTSVNWIGNVFVSATFLTLASPRVLFAAGAFWLYAGISAAGWFWLYTCMPETKGLCLEEVRMLFVRDGDEDAASAASSSPTPPNFGGDDGGGDGGGGSYSRGARVAAGGSVWQRVPLGAH